MKNMMLILRRAAGRMLARTARWARIFSGRKTEPEIASPVYWGDDIALALSNLAQETETRASGRVQVISLADFREAIGPLWDKYESRILIIAESTIGRMIGKGNTYIQQGEDAWMLLFFSVNEAEAQKRTDAMAASIGQKLVGAQFSAEELPLPATARLDMSGAFNADGSIDMEALKASISRIKQSQISKTATRKNPDKSSLPRPAPTSPAGATLSRSNADMLKTFFRPAWCAETESIDTFFFRAAPERGVNIYADDALPVNDATIIDITKTAATAFGAMCDSGLQAKMSVPIPYGTLQGAALAEIRRIVATLPQRERLLRLRLEVARIPANAPVEILIAMREAFRPYVREVAFLVDLYAPNERVLVPEHIMLGADFTTAPTASDEDIFQQMMLFRQRAGRRGTYVLGLHSRAQTNSAVNAGIAEIGGSTFMEDMKRLPHRISNFSREEIMAP